MKLAFADPQKRKVSPRPASHATVFLLRSPVLRCAVAKRPTGKTLPNPAKSSSRSCPHVQAPSPAFLADKGAQPVRRRCSRCYYRLRNQHDCGFGKRWGRKLMAMLITPSFGATPSFLPTLVWYAIITFLMKPLFPPLMFGVTSWSAFAWARWLTTCAQQKPNDRKQWRNTYQQMQLP